MSLIGCTQDCLYQRDGNCTLDQAAPSNLCVPNDYCVHFTPRSAVTPEPPKPREYF